MITSPSPGLLVWLDGELIRHEDAHTPIWSNHYGFGVFEGVRAYRTGKRAAIFRVKDHTARLFRSAHILGMPLRQSWRPTDIVQAQVDVIRENELGDAYLRPFVFYDGVRGLTPHTDQLTLRVAVVALPWVTDTARPEERRGISVRTSTYTHNHPNSHLLRAKANANYMTAMLALAEAKSSGADDAILLDQDGCVTEGTAANVFSVRDAEVWTPPVTSVLEGITRETILGFARGMGLEIREERFTRDDLYSADEVFFTGTASEVTPIREIDGRSIGGCEIGPVTRQLAEFYAATVRGCAAQAHKWITLV
ncbi:branched-chain amino acid aminotransferase [Mycobacterium asiaticum]|uniref:Branched-chain-amino-acid aminotransferase n=1 Tax=Mycobacterium asiaticum TaxID=1790 RepID=A0A1A3NTL0_MYCAS|nr:branched-chain amino acid transaminase [Mycobacterium asiaticum]OBK24379.1 branched-chain amino acid aminotransferase [Mycobacterium asiaticum]